MEAALMRLVWQRAKNRCEYCQMPQAFDAATFEIDHIISQKHHGPTIAGNLCLSCYYCNVFKGSDIRRKRGDYKAAVEKLAAGHMAEGLDRLDTMGTIKPMPAADLYGHATAISRHAQRDTGNPYQGFQIRHLRNPQRTRRLGIGLKHYQFFTLI